MIMEKRQLNSILRLDPKFLVDNLGADGMIIVDLYEKEVFV